jgi:hypothetical protein
MSRFAIYLLLVEPVMDCPVRGDLARTGAVPMVDYTETSGASPRYCTVVTATVGVLSPLPVILRRS